MFGWSIIASAWRSASKRAMTWCVSRPGLMIFRATRRRTGASCSAMNTTPMPPAPICSSSLYGPTAAPGRSAASCARVGSSPDEPTPVGGDSRKNPARSCAANNSSTRARSAASPPHARSRYADRSCADRSSSASVKIVCSSDIACLASGGLDPCEKPGAGVDPVAAGGADRDAQRLGRLLHREAGEVTQLHQLRLLRVSPRKLVQRLVERQQLRRWIVDRQFDELQADPLFAAAAFDAPPAAGVVHEDATHR